jgi:threonine synthase
MPSALSHLECSECGHRHDADRLQTVCSQCGSPLLARYDLSLARRTMTPEAVRARPRGIWRWEELLPVRHPKHRLTLGEGDTRLVPIPRLAAQFGMDSTTVKDESGNPTGSFKARGLAVAVSRAVELGSRELCIPTAGNAGGALAAYAARAGRPAWVFMPGDAPLANRLEIQRMGAELVLVQGLISEAGRQAAEQARRRKQFDLSTFKEPYRLEGKKTMGFELYEQFDGRLPDVILYPTGGGTGLIGMWKAFDELEQLGWIDGRRPRMVVVQAAGCAPIVRAFESDQDVASAWENASTVASGLRVPAPFASRLILRTIRESDGTAVAVSDDEIVQAQGELARSEGLLAAPEGAATWAAFKKLRIDGWLTPNQRVVLFNTGAGLKYL